MEDLPSPGGPESPDDFSVLLRKAREGSREALGCLLEKQRRLLLALANEDQGPHLRAKAGPSDLVQDAFVQAVRNFGDFRGHDAASLRAWLKAILHNIRVNREVAFGAAMRDVQREVVLTPGNSADDPTGALAAGGPSPSSEAGQREQQAILERALGQLPDDYRQVILLRQQDIPWDEVGKALGRSAEAARKLWERALVELGEKVRRPDGPP
jgi:RNA polymerase sigma-70 factor (ECF subfamily)